MLRDIPHLEEGWEARPGSRARLSKHSLPPTGFFGGQSRQNLPVPPLQVPIPSGTKAAGAEIPCRIRGLVPLPAVGPHPPPQIPLLSRTAASAAPGTDPSPDFPRRNEGISALELRDNRTNGFALPDANFVLASHRASPSPSPPHPRVDHPDTRIECAALPAPASPNLGSLPEYS